MTECEYIKDSTQVIYYPYLVGFRHGRPGEEEKIFHRTNTYNVLLLMEL